MFQSFKIPTTTILILAIVSGLFAAICIASTPAFAQKSNQVPTRKRTRVRPVTEGPFKSERVGVRNWLMQAKKRGVGIKGYLAVYNDMENSVKSGQSDEIIKAKLEKIHQSIGDQYQASKKLQSPSRKLSKQRSPYVDSMRGKVDDVFGHDRFTTSHETRRSAEEAERQAIRRLPPEFRGDLRVLQDLRRQRDEREYSMNRHRRFKDRGFTKNPYRYRRGTDGFSAGGGGRRMMNY